MQHVIVGPSVMPYRTADPVTGSLVPTRWPLYARLVEAGPGGGWCGPQIGEVWRNVRTGHHDVHLFGQGVKLRPEHAPSIAAALANHGLTTLTPAQAHAFGAHTREDGPGCVHCAARRPLLDALSA